MESKNENWALLGITDLLNERSDSRTDWLPSWGGAFSTQREADLQFITNRWKNGEPSNSDNKEDCVFYSSGQLNDIECRANNSKAICEKHQAFTDYSFGKANVTSFEEENQNDVERPCLNNESAIFFGDCVEK